MDVRPAGGAATRFCVASDDPLVAEWGYAIARAFYFR